MLQFSETNVLPEVGLKLVPLWSLFESNVLSLPEEACAELRGVTCVSPHLFHAGRRPQCTSLGLYCCR